VSPLTGDRISTPRIIAFAMPAFMISVMLGPTGGMLSGVYAKFFGISLSFIGTAMLVTRLFDAITDPLIGVLSDRTNTRIGRRKPWIIAGTLVSMLAVYMLYSPPADVSGAHFLLWYLLAYLGWTMSEIPTSAWFTELTGDTQKRTKIITFRTVSALLGALAFAAAPLLPIFETTELTPEVLHLVAWVVVIVLPVTVLIALVVVPEGERINLSGKDSLRDTFSSLVQNRPFVLLTALFMLGGLAAGMSGTVGFLYLDTYLLIGDKIAYLTMPAILLTLLSMPVWMMIIKRTGKREAWAVGSAISLLIFPLFTLIEPGPSAFAPYLTLTLLTTVAAASMAVAAPAMMADVVDFGIWKTGTSHAGMYFAVLALLTKANAAAGGAIAYFLLDAFGYDATAKTHDASAVFGMKLAFAYLPMLLYLPTVIGLWKFPIDERRQAIVRRRIESLAERAARETSQSATDDGIRHTEETAP
jgi:GPH family glycoside/pentoside/hexuronide:cation symporter